MYAAAFPRLFRTTAAALALLLIPALTGGAAAAIVNAPPPSSVVSAAAPATPPSVVPSQERRAAPPAQTPREAPRDLMEDARQTVIAWSGHVRDLAVLLGILALLWLAVQALRRRNDLRVTRSLGLCIETRLALGPKKWVVVARFLDKRILLGVTDHQITLLSEFPLEEPLPAKAVGNPRSL